MTDPTDAPPHILPETGHFDGKQHVMPMRIYYEDTDFSGVVYHANYLKFFERARTEFLRAMGQHHSELAAKDNPSAFVVVRAEVDFKRPARIDDVLRIESRITRMKGTRTFFSQKAYRGADELICDGVIIVAAVTMDGRPRKLSKEEEARWRAAIWEASD